MTNSPEAAALEADIMAELNNPEFRNGFEEFMKQIDPNFTEMDTLLQNPEFAQELSSLQGLLKSMTMDGAPSSDTDSSPKPSGSSPSPKTSQKPATSSASSSSSSPSPGKTPGNTQTPQKKDALQDSITSTLNKLKDSDQEVQVAL